MGLYERFRWAEDRFEQRDYLAAARVLEQLLSDAEDTSHGPGHGLGGVRMLLARSYYHSTRLDRAEAAARRLLAEDPTDAYAALLLARTLQRASRHDEAQGALNLAAALGAPGTSFEGEAA